METIDFKVSDDDSFMDDYVKIFYFRKEIKKRVKD